MAVIHRAFACRLTADDERGLRTIAAQAREGRWDEMSARALEHCDAARSSPGAERLEAFGLEAEGYVREWLAPPVVAPALAALLAVLPILRPIHVSDNSAGPSILTLLSRPPAGVEAAWTRELLVGHPPERWFGPAEGGPEAVRRTGGPTGGGWLDGARVAELSRTVRGRLGPPDAQPPEIRSALGQVFAMCGRVGADEWLVTATTM